MVETVVFVHGFLGGARQWLGQIDAIAPELRAVAVTLPGFAERSAERAPETIAGFAESVLQDLTKDGIDRFHLVGHSMGGMIAQEIVARAPSLVAKLVLYGTGPRGELPGRFETLAETRQRVRREGAAVCARRISATWFRAGEASPTYAGCAEIAEEASAQAMDAGLAAMASWSGVAHLSQIRSQTLVLWGDGDRSYRFSEPETLWTTIPGARLAVVPGCAHAVHLEKPDLFNALLTDHLVG